MKDKKYLLFDLDGTLTDPREGITKSVQYALAACGIDEPELSALEHFIGPTLEESFGGVYKMDETQMRYAIKKYRERYVEKGIYENRLLPGTEKLLRRLKDCGRVLALATSKPTPFALETLRMFSVDRFFTVAVGSEPENGIVTKGDVIREVLTRLEVDDPSSAVMIGDRRHDIEGARECGLDAIGLEVGFASPGELEAAGAAAVCRGFDELYALLT